MFDEVDEEYLNAVCAMNPLRHYVFGVGARTVSII
jgi:hypothetical protein